MQELLTPKEVAHILKVTENTVREMLKDGRIKGYKLGKVWRIRKNELDNFVNQKGE